MTAGVRVRVMVWLPTFLTGFGSGAAHIEDHLYVADAVEALSKHLAGPGDPLGIVALDSVAMAADAGLGAIEGRAFVKSLERELEDCAAPSRSDRTYFGTLAVVGRIVPEPRRSLIATMHRREDPVITNSDLIGWASFDRWAQLPQISTLTLASPPSIASTLIPRSLPEQWHPPPTADTTCSARNWPTTL